MLLFVLGASVLFSTTALASPVQWNFSSTFGGDDNFIPYGGSFVYDADTMEFSDIFVSTGAGPVLPATTYTLAFGPSLSDRLNVVSSPNADLTGATVFILYLNGLMTNDGGELAIYRGHERLCIDATCTFDLAVNPWRGLTNTIFTGVPAGQVPEPSSLALLAAGLFGLRFARRRHGQAQVLPLAS